MIITLFVVHLGAVRIRVEVDDAKDDDRQAGHRRPPRGSTLGWPFVGLVAFHDAEQDEHDEQRRARL